MNSETVQLVSVYSTRGYGHHQVCVDDCETVLATDGKQTRTYWDSCNTPVSHDTTLSYMSSFRSVNARCILLTNVMDSETVCALTGSQHSLERTDNCDSILTVTARYRGTYSDSWAACMTLYIYRALGFPMIP